jgi:hypothetical protein
MPISFSVGRQYKTIIEKEFLHYNLCRNTNENFFTFRNINLLYLGDKMHLEKFFASKDFYFWSLECRLVIFGDLKQNLKMECFCNKLRTKTSY